MENRRNVRKGVHRALIIRIAQVFREHKVGIPEWLKNSHDSYVRHEKKGDLLYDVSRLPIIINITKSAITCLDFGGVNPEKLDRHILFHGDPEAATLGEITLKDAVTGGHGNGGKFYGISQFEECNIIDYYEGKLTTYTLTKTDDKPGVYEKPENPKAVAKSMGLDRWLYFSGEKQLYYDIMIGKVNVFCWQGIKPRDTSEISSARYLNKLIRQIVCNPQAITVLRSRKVDILFNGEIYISGLKPIEIVEDPTIHSREFRLPDNLEQYKFNKKGVSVLRVRFSVDRLVGDKEGLNTLDITVHGKPIATYHLPEWLMNKGSATYLTATIECPELAEYECITNERNTLAPNPISALFLDWCKEKIQSIVDEIDAKERKETEIKELQATQEFLQDVMNKLSSILEQEDILKNVYSSKGETATVEVPTEELGGYGGSGHVKKPGAGKRRGKKVLKDDKGLPKKDMARPKILISGLDKDPLNPGQDYIMSPRDPLLYQRPQDVQYGFWWLNSQKDYIKRISVREPAGKPFYLFVVKEVALFQKSRRMFSEETENLSDKLQGLDLDLIDEIFNKVVVDLKIPLANESVASVIRNYLKDKQRFTVNDMASETGLEPSQINAYLKGNLKREIVKNFKEHKEENDAGSVISVYERLQ